VFLLPHNRAWLFLTVFHLLALTPAIYAEELPDVHLALLRYPGGNFNPRPNGLLRLTWELRRRTSIDAALDIAQVDPNLDDLYSYPFVIWQGDKEFPPLTPTTITHLRQHLNKGGTLWVDVSDGIVNGSFYGSVVRDLKRIFPDGELKHLETSHVLYKAFYLIDRHGGRIPSRSYLEAMFVDNRLAVVISFNDVLGAMSRDAFGEWDYPTGDGGMAARESSYRLAINLVMYALCLDYKDDQVHIPFILQRRR